MPAPAIRLVPVVELSVGAGLAAEVLALAIHALFLAMASAMLTSHGSPPEEKASKNPAVPEVPETVAIPPGEGRPRFRLGRTPVTNAQYAAFLAASPEAVAPPWWTDPAFSSPRQPVVGVTWDETAAYCAWLARVAGGTWRLPAEAEWELAMSGGLADPPTPWGDELPSVEIPAGPLAGPWEVGRGVPNAFGILDPGTVVHEWCLDWREPEGDLAAAALPRRASRGGSWRHRIRWSSPSARSSLPPGYRYSDYGFRVLLEVEPGPTLTGG
jgi:formylglycine-generating enzyme required for sulfatase activity